MGLGLVIMIWARRLIRGSGRRMLLVDEESSFSIQVRFWGGWVVFFFWRGFGGWQEGFAGFGEPVGDW